MVCLNGLKIGYGVLIERARVLGVFTGALFSSTIMDTGGRGHLAIGSVLVDWNAPVLRKYKQACLTMVFDNLKIGIERTIRSVE